MMKCYRVLGTYTENFVKTDITNLFFAADFSFFFSNRTSSTLVKHLSTKTALLLSFIFTKIRTDKGRSKSSHQSNFMTSSTAFISVEASFFGLSGAEFCGLFCLLCYGLASPASSAEKMELKHDNFPCPLLLVSNGRSCILTSGLMRQNRGQNRTLMQNGIAFHERLYTLSLCWSVTVSSHLNNSFQVKYLDEEYVFFLLLFIILKDRKKHHIRRISVNTLMVDSIAVECSDVRAIFLSILHL